MQQWNVLLGAAVLGFSMLITYATLLDSFEGFTAITASKKDLDRAMRAKAATTAPIFQPGPGYQVGSHQPVWAGHIAAMAETIGTQLIMCDALTALLYAPQTGWSVLATTREPCRVLLVFSVSDTPNPVSIAEDADVGLGNMGVRSWNELAQWAKYRVKCCTAAEAVLARSILEVEVDQMETPFSSPGIWALLIPHDSEIISRLQELYKGSLIQLIDYSGMLYQSSKKGYASMQLQPRSVFMDSASILTGTVKAGPKEKYRKSVPLILAAYDYCILCPVDACNKADWVSRVPNIALLDVGDMAKSGMPICPSSLLAAATRFKDRQVLDMIRKDQKHPTDTLVLHKETATGYIEAAFINGTDARNVPARAGDTVDYKGRQLIQDVDGMLRSAHPVTVSDAIDAKIIVDDGIQVELQLCNIPKWHKFIYLVDMDIVTPILEYNDTTLVRVKLDSV